MKDQDNGWSRVEEPVEAAPVSSQTEMTEEAVTAEEGVLTEETLPPRRFAALTRLRSARERRRRLPVMEAADDDSGTVPPLATESELQPPSRRGRYTASGRRRGARTLAAPLGFCILLLAAVGLVSLIVSGIQAVERAQDTTALRAELEEFLLPVIQYNPQAFDDVDETTQDAPLLAAIWRVTEAERIRQLRENTDVSAYAMDDLSRMLIPIEEIEASYAFLFGPDAVPRHHTIGDKGMSFTFEYDPDAGYYHVPNTSASSIYVSVLDTVKKKGDTLTVRVGYVLTTKLTRDEKGELMAPTPDMAEYFQLYTVRRRSDDSLMLVSIADEAGATTVATTIPTTTAAAETTAATAADTTAAAADGTSETNI